MAAPFVENIKDVTEEIWPAVRDAIAEMSARRGGAPLPGRNRRITEQVVWELAKAGLLVTPEQAEVLELARKWRAAWEEDPIVGDDATEEDAVLYHAIGELR